MVSKQLERNKQLVKSWINQKLQGNGNPLEDLASNISFFVPGASNNPIFGHFNGIDEVTHFFKLLQKKLAKKRVQQTFEFINCIAEDNQVVVFLEEIFTFEDSPEQPYRNQSAWLFKLNDQMKITYICCYDNTLVNSQILA
jgi:hypothetical protein